MNKKEEGLSILDLIKLVFYSWKRLVIMMAVFIIGFILAIHFGYTANSKIYTIEFSYIDENLKTHMDFDLTKLNNEIEAKYMNKVGQIDSFVKSLKNQIQEKICKTQTCRG